MADFGNSTPAPGDHSDAIPHPAIERMDLRKRMITAVEQMLTAVDLLIHELDLDAPDPDLEPDGSDEPSLGFEAGRGWNSERTDAALVDLEDEHDGREPDVDDEPSLGSLDGARRLVVTRRAKDGRALSTRLSDPLDQSRWADTGCSDLEEACEDEGGACEDEGAFTGDDEGDAQASCITLLGDDFRRVWPPAGSSLGDAPTSVLQAERD